MSEFPTMTQAEMLAQSNIGEGDLVIGQDYFGSKVVKVKQEVKENDEYYHIKRFVTLLNGIILVEESRKRTSLGKITAKEYGAAPGEMVPEKKDDTDTRARARAMMAKRKSEMPKQKKEKKKKKKKRESEPMPRRKSAPKEPSPEPKAPEPEPKSESLRRVSSPSPEPVRKAPSPSPVRRSPSPSPVRRAPSPSPSPSPSPVRIAPSLSPVRRAPSPEPEPEPKTPSVFADDWNIFEARVVPESEAPATCEDDELQVGVWKHDDADDSQWKAMDVEIHKEQPLDLKEGEPHGIVAVEKDAKANHVGKIDPKRLKFFASGKNPDFPKDSSIGFWRPKKDKDKSWKPRTGKKEPKEEEVPIWQPKSKPGTEEEDEPKDEPSTHDSWEKFKAMIVPTTKQNEGVELAKETGVPVGIWENDEDTDDTKWDPVNVVVHKKKPDGLNPDNPHGVVTVPKDVGDNPIIEKLKPEQLKFYASGEKPNGASGEKPLGTWVGSRFPPLSNSDGENSPNVGNFPLRKRDKDWVPVKAIVFLLEKAPNENKATEDPKGVWKSKDPLPDDWIPKEVLIYPKDAEIDEDIPNGIWGTRFDSLPNEEGQLKPEDVLFYPPRESPDDDCKTLGKWALGDKEQWPPTSDGPKKPQRSQSLYSTQDIGQRGRKSHDDVPEIIGVPGKLPPWQEDNGWKIGKALVYPGGKTPKDNNDDISRGAWRSKDALPDDWIPQEVTIFPQDTDVKDDTPNGVWGTDPTSKPDENGQYKPKDVLFYPPSETPEKEQIIPRGKWALGEKTKWPPELLSPKKPIRKLSPYMSRKPREKDQPEMIGNFLANGDDDWVPIKALVFPTKKAPKENKRTEYLKGVWKSKDVFPDDWIPKEVTIHPKNTPIDEDTPSGFWGTSLASVPNKEGQWKPEDVLFFPPSESPDEDCNTLGKWALGDTKEWPPTSDGPKKPKRTHSPHYVQGIGDGRKLPKEIPEEPKGVEGKLLPWQKDNDWKIGKALVYPKGKAPNGNNDDISRGTWRSKDALPDDWIPQEVTIYPQNADLKNDNPNGVWGTDPISEPDETGQYKPKDILFYPPNETPEEEGVVPRGRWELGEREKWPPASVSPKKPHRTTSDRLKSNENADDDDDNKDRLKMGSLPLWQKYDDWIKDKAMVYPKCKVPENNTDALSKGTWKSKDPLSDDWIPQEVTIYPQNTDVKDDTPNGVWGTDRTSEPDENGQYKPKDVLFYPPSETPDDEIVPRGRWAMDREWPPTSESPKKPHRVNSKKLENASPLLPLWQDKDDWVPTKAIVFPKCEAPSENKDDFSRGVWKSKDPLPENMVPSEVIIHPKNIEIDDASNPNGVWGTNSFSTPDEFGQWKPEDVFFYPPSETPDDDCIPRGRWELGDNKPWPPTCDAPKQPHRVDSPKMEYWESPASSHHSTMDGSQTMLPVPFDGSGHSRTSQNQSPRQSPVKGRPRLSKKPSLPSILEENWDTLPGKVVSASDKTAGEASEDSTEPHLGTWKHNDDTDDKDWGSMDIIINKMQPEDLRPDEPHGAVAITEGTKPNLAGKLNPQQLHFFTPGEEPEASMKQVGVWRPESPTAKWPPPKKASKKSNLPSILEDSWDTLPCVVIPASHEDADKAPKDVTEPHLGCWKQPDNIDDKDWGPLDAIVSKTEPDDLASDEPHGIVVIPKNVESNDAGKLDPKDLQFLPPGEKANPDMKEVGHWRPQKWKGEWPPPKKTAERKHLLTKKLPKWQTDSDWIEDRAVVYHNDVAPNKNEGSVCRGSWYRDILSADEIWADLTDPQEVTIWPANAEPEGDAPTGVWGTSLDSIPDEDGQWKPGDVIFYPPMKEPGEECVPRGRWSLVGPAPDYLLAIQKPRHYVSMSPKLPKKKAWTGISPTSPSVRRSVGRLKVPHLFGLPVTPGKSPMSARRKSRLPKLNKKIRSSDLGKSILDNDWKRLPAKVIPKSSTKDTVPNATAPIIGVWEQSDDTKDDSKWAPMDVIVEKDKPKDLAPNEPHGLVALKSEAEANENTNLKPKEVIFYPPGEEPKPDDNVKKVGTWRTGKLNSPWPPATEVDDNRDTLPNVPKWQTDGDWIKDKAIVYPKEDAPVENENSVSEGVWETYEPLPDGLLPQEVIIQPVGAKPEGNTRNGIWGTSTESLPDKKGRYKPKDVLFYPPTKEPGDECTPRGRWTLVGPISPLVEAPKKPVRQLSLSPPSPRKSVLAKVGSPRLSMKAEWKKNEQATPQSQRKVGKLKVPFVFGQKPDIDSSISPKRSPRRPTTGRLSRRVSNFTNDILGEFEKSRGDANVVKRSDKEEQKLEGKSNDKDKAQAAEEDNIVPKTGLKSYEAVEELKPAAVEGEFRKPQREAMRYSMSALSHTAAKPRAKAMRASISTLNPNDLELKSLSASKKVGKLKLPAAFNGK